MCYIIVKGKQLIKLIKAYSYSNGILSYMVSIASMKHSQSKSGRKGLKKWSTLPRLCSSLNNGRTETQIGQEPGDKS